jgi:hypothetical protein
LGSVARLADGRWDVRFRLWDVVRGQDLGGQSYAVAVADLRLAAHRIADFIYEKLTGDKGVFSTRIAYVTKAANRFNLVGGRLRRRERAVGAGERGADHLAGLVGQRGAIGLCFLRIAQAGGLRARGRQRQTPADRQLSAVPTVPRPGRRMAAPWQ